MASAATRGDTVLTGDTEDLTRLSRFFPSVRILGCGRVLDPHIRAMSETDATLLVGQRQHESRPALVVSSSKTRDRPRDNVAASMRASLSVVRLAVLLLLSIGCGRATTTGEEEPSSGPDAGGDASDAPDASVNPDTKGPFTVTPHGSHVTVSPAGSILVYPGATTAFTVTPDTWYETTPTVTGTCAAGTWSGVVYTTGAITADCSLAFEAKPIVEVTASSDPDASISPSGAFAIEPGSAQSFTVTPKSGAAISPIVRGTCPAGTWADAVFTTAPISADCAIQFASVVPVLRPPTWTTSSTDAAPITAELTKLTGVMDAVKFDFGVDHGPLTNRIFTAQAVATSDQVVRLAWTWNGARSSDGGLMNLTGFADSPEGRTTVTAYENNPGKTVALSGTVSLTLRAGYAFGITTFDSALMPTLSGTLTLTTLETIPSYHVTATAGAQASLSAPGVTVVRGATPGITVTVPDGVTLPSVPGGTCPAGSWNGSHYTTGPITADCTVAFDQTGTPGADAGAGDAGAGDAGAGDAGTPNQAPTLALGPSLAFDTAPLFYTSLAWATVSPGPAAEAPQRLAAELSVTSTTGTLAFDTPPTLDTATGNLYFATSAGTSGTATVLVTLKDDGGTESGGADTTTGSFTLRVNTPPVEHDINVINPWMSDYCIPLTPGADDIDPDDTLSIEFTSYPHDGIIDCHLPVNSRGWYEFYGVTGEWNHALTCCYTPLSHTFKGLDSFTYVFRDNHGGLSGTASATLELIEWSSQR